MAETKEMAELKKVKPTEAKLFIQGREREIKFSFKVWAKLEEEYGGLKNFSKIEKDIMEKPFHVVPHLLFLALVDKLGVTEDNILDDYGLQDLDKVTDVLYLALYGSLPEEKKKAVAKKTQ